MSDGIDRARARRAARDASGVLYVDSSIYEGMEACLVRSGQTVAHVAKYADAVELANAVVSVARIHEAMDEDGGCWSPCSGCQEGVDGCVSTKDYPYSATFKCQPGGGCRECGGIGVLWQDGAFLASYGDALSLSNELADENDSAEARLDMVRVALQAIVDGGDAMPLARAGIDFCDLTQAERENMRGDQTS